MSHDDIIKEVRNLREQLAAQHGYNVRALYEDAKKCQQKKQTASRQTDAPVTGDCRRKNSLTSTCKQIPFHPGRVLQGELGPVAVAPSR